MAVLDTTDIVRALLEFSEIALAEIGEEFVDTAKGHASRRSGALAEGVQKDPVDIINNEMVVTVHSYAKHSSWQNEGTGIYGPMGTRIFPTRAKALRFDWPAAGGVVFFQSVAGQEGNRWWDRTIEEFDEIIERADIPNAD